MWLLSCSESCSPAMLGFLHSPRTSPPLLFVPRSSDCAPWLTLGQLAHVALVAEDVLNALL
jgi:hypothetical protein